MGKRSNFERRERDFYATPVKAVQPLIPHLRAIRTFAEPCVGEEDLVRHLEAEAGLRCVFQGDIRTGQDALLLTVEDLTRSRCNNNESSSRSLAHAPHGPPFPDLGADDLGC